MPPASLGISFVVDKLSSLKVKLAFSRYDLRVLNVYSSSLPGAS